MPLRLTPQQRIADPSRVGTRPVQSENRFAAELTGPDLTADEVAFGRAVHALKTRNGAASLEPADYLNIARSLGFTKIPGLPRFKKALAELTARVRWPTNSETLQTLLALGCRPPRSLHRV